METGDLSGAHLTAFAFEEKTQETVDEDAPKPVNEQGQIVEEETLTKVEKDGFYATFKYMLAFPSFSDPDFKPLAVQPEEEEGARAASDAIYELLEIWYPQALMSGNKTLVLLFASGSFLYAKVQVARSIIIAKRLRNVEVPEAAPEPPKSDQPETPRGII